MVKTPHKQIIIKFGLLLCLLLGYGLATGGLVTTLTWSFFRFVHPRRRCWVPP